MNKKIKRIIATTLAITAICAIEPTKYFNLTTTKAYAASEVNLKSLYLSEGEINFSKDKKTYEVKVDGDVEDIRITAKPDCAKNKYDKYTVDIDGATVSEEEGFRTIVPLIKGENEIKVKIENEDGKKKIYKLNIIRGRVNRDDPYEDDIYLKNIELDYGEVDIDFDKDKTSYNVNVDKNMKEIIIKARPDDSYDIVRIDGAKVEKYSGSGDKDEKEKKGYKKTVKLNEGKNKIEIEVSNDENEKIYTLNINRGKSKDKTTETEEIDKKDNNNNLDNKKENLDNSNKAKAEINKWIIVNDKWQYNDENGNLIKERWFKDPNTGKEYYFNIDGNMLTGWLPKENNWYYLGDSGDKKIGWQNVSGSWYYLGNDGIMKTGWQQEGQAWYYLNNNGKMLTGWIKDFNGKYYYLYESGKMAKNTIVNGYKLGNDGAWIK